VGFAGAAADVALDRWWGAMGPFSRTAPAGQRHEQSRADELANSLSHGWALFGVVSGLALAGIALKSFGKDSHPIFSTGLHLLMG
jgi:hypothetical protein